jgi:hypothetical protein
MGLMKRTLKYYNGNLTFGKEVDSLTGLISTCFNSRNPSDFEQTHIPELLISKNSCEHRPDFIHMVAFGSRFDRL